MSADGAGPGDSPDLLAAKQALRREMALGRERVSESDALVAGTRIARFLSESEEFRSAGAIAMFMSIAGEPDMRPSFELAIELGKQLALPRCDGHATMRFHAVTDLGQLRPGAYGILEPATTCPTLAVRDLPYVLLPGVAFDEAGHRIGRGRGYYDRAFAAGDSTAFLVGVGFDFQIVDRVPTGARDRRVDAIVTERGILATSSTRNAP